MRFRGVWAMTAVLAFTATVTAAEPTSPVDRLLEKETAGRKVQQAPLVDDLAFLRRLSVDLNGRIPSEEEIQSSQAARKASGGSG